MPSSKKTDVVLPTANFLIVGLTDYDIEKKTKHYIQVNHVIEKPTIKMPKQIKNLKTAEFNVMVDLKTFFSQNFIFWSKTATTEDTVAKQPKKRAPKKVSPVLTELTERFFYYLLATKLFSPKK